MRLVLLLSALLALARCSAVSQYDATSGQDPASLTGNQGGAGIQAPIWSDDPSKKTITNQNPSQ